MILDKVGRCGVALIMCNYLSTTFIAYTFSYPAGEGRRQRSAAEGEASPSLSIPYSLLLVQRRKSFYNFSVFSVGFVVGGNVGWDWVGTLGIVQSDVFGTKSGDVAFACLVFEAPKSLNCTTKGGCFVQSWNADWKVHNIGSNLAPEWRF